MKPLLLAAMLGVAVLPLRARVQSPKVEELIPKATAYAHDFVARFSNVVAEERYEQEITVPKRKRVLVSDFLLVKPVGDEIWRPFRDVAEVDGRPVRDREDRVVKLLLQPSSSAMRRAEEIRDAGARYHLLDVGSLSNVLDVGTLGNPILVLAFLQEQYVGRFRFNLAGLDKNLGPDVRTVRFEEFRQPTVLRQSANNDLFSRGLIWIEEGTGRVVQTELRLGGQPGAFRITTQFAFDEDLGINVPAALEESYPVGFGEFRSKATYGTFRRIAITTQEAIQPWKTYAYS